MTKQCKKFIIIQCLNDMKTQQNNSNSPMNSALKLIALFALIGVVLVTLLVTQTPQFLQGALSPERLADNSCQSLRIKTVPSPVLEDQQATVIIETVPADFEGTYNISSSSGSLTAPDQTEGSYFQTAEKVLTYSGGDKDSRITVQAIGEANVDCFDTVVIQEKDHITCESIEITTYPSPVPQNESIDLTISTLPETWNGSYLVRADSGKFLLTGADKTSEGANTNTLITSLNKIVYTGGKAGEQITIEALGEGNESCSVSIAIAEDA